MYADRGHLLARNIGGTATSGRVDVVARPPGAEVSADLLQSLGHRAAYHNAELTEDERELVESRLQGATSMWCFLPLFLRRG